MSAGVRNLGQRAAVTRRRHAGAIRWPACRQPPSCAGATSPARASRGRARSTHRRSRRPASSGCPRAAGDSSTPPSVPPGPIRRRQGYILSAVSDDGLRFTVEDGIRIAPDPTLPWMSRRALAPTITLLDDGRWRMYFEARGRRVAPDGDRECHLDRPALVAGGARGPAGGGSRCRRAAVRAPARRPESDLLLLAGRQERGQRRNVRWALVRVGAGSAADRDR